jgi:hypothetical protein
MKTKLQPGTAWAIVDEFDNTIMERTGTGLLNVYYSEVDAEVALLEVKLGADSPTARRLRVIEIRLSHVSTP